MNNKIASGIWLVFFGIVFLLHNFRIIDFNFYSLINLWPLLLISVGVTLLLQNRPNSKIIIILSNVLLCGFIFFKGVTSNDGLIPFINVTNDDNESFIANNRVTQSLNEEEGTARMELNAGAAKFIIDSEVESQLLIDASTASKNSSLDLKSSDQQGNHVELTTQVKSSKSNNNNTFFVHLNDKPIWDLEYNLGAANIQADFKKLKLGSLSINSGATNLSIYLPTPTQETSQIELNTAASSIKLYLPKGAACKVETETIFSNNKFEDVPVVEDKARKTTDYDLATHKYHIVVEGAANSLSILRY
ncbi:LiaI-LiaF-like domain-containing protein [Sphingobacterium sp. HJSM2_6]|uniref:LiaI-LiaF-like domain-containing protein n=1 Tax=Sphingobacterium sp. HJSM2_6 TaxID=3366264 RepID=UPI003BE1A43C